MEVLLYDSKYLWGGGGGKSKIKAIHVTGRANLQNCDTSRIAHFLDNCLTDSDDTVGLTCWLALPPKKDS
jgi:hypothetical protein